MHAIASSGARPRGVLFVSEKFPYPIDDGGQIRTYHVLRAIAAAVPVTLLALAPPRPEHEGPIRDLGIEVVTFPRRGTAFSRAFHAGAAVFGRRPYPLNKNFSRAILAEIRARIAAGSARAVHFNHLDAAQYVEHLGELRSRVLAVFDSHNVLTTMYQRFYETAVNPLRRAYCALQWSKMHRFERRVMAAVDRVLVCSDVERELLHRWGVNGATVVPNGVDTRAFDRASDLDEVAARDGGAAPRIVFTGALDYAPNEEAMLWFLAEAWPELERLVPHIELEVVGKHPSDRLRARTRRGITFTGYVSDVRPHLARADVAIVPMRIGGGTRLKILEAMAARVPVVSTSVGAEGLAAADGEHLRIADGAPDLARAIAGLLGDPALAQKIAERARALVVERYDWESVTRPVADLYRALLD